MKGPMIFKAGSSQTTRDRGIRTGKQIVPFVYAGILVVACVAMFALWFTFRLYQTLPTVDELINMKQSIVSRVLAKDGTLIHEFGMERRIWVPYKDIPPELVQAIISIEDRRFYSHWGVDLRRIFGALVVDVLHRGYAQGASTLTQQLARNVYLTSEQSIVRKIREIMTSVQIEFHYTKEEILELYLNQVYLGNGGYGMGVAASQYFTKPVRTLTLNECATLAGMIQSPEYYRPDKKKNIARITVRRNSVIHAMLAMHYITAKQAKEVLAMEIPSNPAQDISKEAPYFIEQVRKYVIQKYGEDELYTNGLTIYSTLDPLAQDSAEISLARQMKFMQARLNRMFTWQPEIRAVFGKMPLDSLNAHFDSLYVLHKEAFAHLPDTVKHRIAQSGVIVMDVHTGAIRALIGGRDFEESKFNRIFQAMRQPGSAFKPIVYTAAIDHGFAPASVILDQPVTITTPQGEWRPQNYDGEFNGPVTLRFAIKKSLNLAAIQLFLQVGGDTVVDYARKLGITAPIMGVPSLAIGSCEVKPIELVCAYAAFPNGGRVVAPYCIEKIVDRHGKVLEKTTPSSTEAISPQTAYIMCDLMTEVVRHGTAASIAGRGFTRPAGGKTGTTNEYSDAWFVGYTPQLVCGVWVGVDDRLSLGRGVTGGDAALPIWVPTMIAAHKNLPLEDFKNPGGVTRVAVCQVSHKLANASCPAVRQDVFKSDQLPESCDIHGARGARGTGSPTDRFFDKSPSSTNAPPSGKPKKRLMF